MKPLLVPPAVVTLTPTEPAVTPAGTVTLSWVSETTVGVAGTPPKDTLVAVERPTPLTVIVFPPTSGPDVALSEDLNGAPT